MEFEVAELVYINDTWIKPEYQKFTLEQDLPTALINKMLKYITPVGSKGPNYTALKNALDRLAAAIKNKIGGEAIYPFTIEEMCQIVASANEGEKGKEGFFYYMGKMAYYIAERYGVELPLTIEEMIEALGETSSTNIITFTINTYGTYQAEAGMTWYEWVNSSYGGGSGHNWICNSAIANVMNIAGSGKVQYNGINVIGSDKIIANATYTVFIDGSGFEF